MTKEGIDREIRLNCLAQANLTVSRDPHGPSQGSDALVIRVAQRFERYVLTGELTPPTAEAAPAPQ